MLVTATLLSAELFTGTMQMIDSLFVNPELRFILRFKTAKTERSDWITLDIT